MLQIRNSEQRVLLKLLIGFGLCLAERPYKSSSRYKLRSNDLSRSLGSRIGINSLSWGSTRPPLSRDWYLPVNIIK